MIKNPSHWWYLNVKSFTNETTFHGIKFVFADTRYWIRRLVNIFVCMHHFPDCVFEQQIWSALSFQKQKSCRLLSIVRYTFDEALSGDQKNLKIFN